MQRDHFDLILSLEERHIINKLFTRNVCSVQENLISYLSQMCPEMQVNEIQALYDKHHKVASFPKSHQNTYNSVKYIEDITRWREDMNFMFEWQEQYIVLATRT